MGFFIMDQCVLLDRTGAVYCARVFFSQAWQSLTGPFTPLISDIFWPFSVSFNLMLLSYISWYTVTESADSGFIPLLRRPQGPQGCLEKHNYPLIWNLTVWCAKIGSKTQKLQKTVKNTSFFFVFHVISEGFFWKF